MASLSEVDLADRQNRKFRAFESRLHQAHQRAGNAYHILYT
ncbi:hypothetical protein Q5692_34765 [Microcoleus sp. C2C3]